GRGQYLAEQRAVVLVGQAPERLGGRQEGAVGEGGLGEGGRLGVGEAGEPGDLALLAARVAVAGGPGALGLGAGGAHAGLLLDLAQGGLEERLARLGVALGEDPVAVLV